MDKLLVFTDGGARGNPGPAAAGVVVKNSRGEVIFSQKKFLGKKTNNEAEYAAVELAVAWLEKNLSLFSQVEFYFDSLLVTKQLKGEWKVKAAHLRPQVVRIRKKLAALGKPVDFFYLPRKKNTLADALVNQALDEAGF